MPLEVAATCPDCGAGNAIRAGNQMDRIFCGSCGWVTDPDWDGPQTRTELREQRRAERDPPDHELTMDDITDAIDSIDTMTRSEAAIQQALKRYQERLDRHVLGAWMAGYEAVDVVTPIGQPRHAAEDGYDPAVPAITGRVKVWKEYPEDDDGGELNPYDSGMDVERYDLRDIRVEDVREARGESND